MTTQRSKAYFAAIDLGSNSFHMLVVRVVAGGVQVVSKIKRKVRLAAGLQQDGSLDDAAKTRALDCLKIFADRVHDIDPLHIRAVGTATLRKVHADKGFLDACARTLGHPIEVISGEEEAATIYQGIAHTTAFQQRMLIIDIGGASTELVLGQGFQADVLNSLDLGCVTWYSRFFAPENGLITTHNTQAAIKAAELAVKPIASAYQGAGEGLVLGASGTFKALQEIASAEQRPQEFALSWLEQILAQVVASGHHDKLNIHGLKENRKSVFVSGLCILIGVCKSLGIQSLQPTSGALREGIIYGLLHQSELANQQADIQQRTLDTIAATYHLDTEQSRRVIQLTDSFYQQLQPYWAFPDNANELIRAVAYLHELGLSLAYKQASAHASYMIQHLDMPGFNHELRQQVVALIAACAGIIDDESDASIHPQKSMRHLERILRLAIVLCQRRTNESLVQYHLVADDECLHLQAPASFVSDNPFLMSLLHNEQESLNNPESLIVEPRT